MGTRGASANARHHLRSTTAAPTAIPALKNTHRVAEPWLQLPDSFARLDVSCERVMIIGNNSRHRAPERRPLADHTTVQKTRLTDQNPRMPSASAASRSRSRPRFGWMSDAARAIATTISSTSTIAPGLTAHSGGSHPSPPSNCSGQPPTSGTSHSTHRLTTPDSTTSHSLGEPAGLIFGILREL